MYLMRKEYVSRIERIFMSTPTEQMILCTILNISPRMKIVLFISAYLNSPWLPDEVGSPIGRAADILRPPSYPASDLLNLVIQIYMTKEPREALRNCKTVGKGHGRDPMCLMCFYSVKISADREDLFQIGLVSLSSNKHEMLIVAACLGAPIAPLRFSEELCIHITLSRDEVTPVLEGLFIGSPSLSCSVF